MSKLSEEASAIFNFTLDESLAVIQHNTRLLNYYIQLEQKEMSPSDKNRRFQPIIARIHSNLGDLHYWDEDYYKASLEYRAAIDAFNEDDKQGFLTRIRCMLKLGFTYESRKLYPNAYQLYCQLISLLIKRRWVDERSLGLDIIETRAKGWREKRLSLVDPMVRAEKMTQTFGIINLAQGQYRRKPKNKKNIILTIAINSSNIFGKVMKNWLWNMV